MQVGVKNPMGVTLGAPESWLELILKRAAPPKFDMRASLGKNGAGMPGSLTWESMRGLFKLGRDIIGGPFAFTDVGARDGRALMCSMYFGADNAHGPELEPFYCVDGPRRNGSVIGSNSEPTGFGPRFMVGRKLWASSLTDSFGIATHPMSMHVDYGSNVMSYDSLDAWPSPPLFGGRSLPRFVFQFDAVFEDHERAVCYRLSQRDASVRVVMTTWKDKKSVEKAKAELGSTFQLVHKVGVGMTGNGKRAGERKTMLVFKRT
jgi:hypothetical protein